jgi:uncharacterized protein YajQ (UPF0234 family)
MEVETKDVSNENAKILMRQTDYTLEECLEILKTKDIQTAIKDFLGIVEKKDESGTTNQKIYKLIRENLKL